MALPSLTADTTCMRCHALMGNDDRFCPSCGADREVEWQVAAIEMTKMSQARKWILGIGIWYLVSHLLLIVILGPQATALMKKLLLITGSGLCLVHVGLWLWAKRAPLAAAVVSLVLFVTLHSINAALDPSSIYKGIIIKVLFVAVLVKAIQAGYEVHRLRNQRA